MDLKVLNILFNYKGEISAKEFRIGIVILFMTLGVYFSILLRNPIASIVDGGLFVETNDTYFILRNIFINFVPNLIPMQLILFYCSFVLAIKRMRAFSNNCAIISLSGLINYLFFCALVSFYFFVEESFKSYNDFLINTIAIILYGIILIGLIYILFLARKKEGENNYEKDEKGKLSIENYALKIGKLMLYSAIITPILIIILLPMTYAFHSAQIISTIIPMIFGIIIFCFYIRYVIRRMRDAGISQIWIAVIFGVYFFSLTINLIFNFHFKESRIYSNLIFLAIHYLFIAFQFILFLLPSKQEPTSPTPPKEGLTQSDEEF